MRYVVKVIQSVNFILNIRIAVQRSLLDTNRDTHTNSKMKAFTLSFATLCLVALAQGHIDYNLKCTKEEIGIRWPSYHSNSDYYVCQRIGGKQLKVSCNEGELFTFVLQACTGPERFIPPPPMDILPTASPLPAHTMPLYPGVDLPGLPLLPQPLYPTHSHPQPHPHPEPAVSPMQPPVLIDEHPLSWEMPHINLPHHVGAESAEETGNQIDNISSPHIPLLPSIKPSLPEKPNSDAGAPLPPTPAPTPPVLQSHLPPKKTPQGPNKKPALPNKKQPTVGAQKQPPTAQKKTPVVAKKQTPTVEKKQPPALKSVAKKPIPQVPSKA